MSSFMKADLATVGRARDPLGVGTGVITEIRLLWPKSSRSMFNGRALTSDHDESIPGITAETSGRWVYWRSAFTDRSPQVLSVSVPDVRYFIALLRGVSFVNVGKRAIPPGTRVLMVTQRATVTITVDGFTVTVEEARSLLGMFLPLTFRNSADVWVTSNCVRIQGHVRRIYISPRSSRATIPINTADDK